ncbi:Ketol-acid reductoisomerase [Planctomycetes bacterium Pan216]|uniref:Ketol-acid reductoisomerase n=1 Tax=Kolteria novifilia TaxID=2527975 RepID=A0A518B268_9BACT|nr:Ketol-acid reductoisomerase [Planctomycetes bacterium Pan216]
MATVYREADAHPDLLTERTIAIVGFGNQGRAQALNLRDSGAKVIVGNIDDNYRAQAIEDGFEVFSIAEAVEAADVVMLLLPDEIAPEVYTRDIASHLRAGDAISFASGYNVHYEHIVCPEDVDVVLLAPRMIGRGVRDLYLSGDGFFSFVGVHQDASGGARDVMLALASGIGTLRKGAVDVSFQVETELDLFNEQGFGPAFGRVLLTSIDTLIKAGYPKEAVLLEFYLSGEMSYIFQAMAEMGLIEQLDAHSQTSQYGAISRGMRFLGINLKRPMRKILDNIRRGKFAREWNFEQRTGKVRFRLLRALAKRQPIGKIEKEVRKELGIGA